VPTRAELRQYVTALAEAEPQLDARGIVERLVLADGAVAAFRPDGTSSFQALQNVDVGGTVLGCGRSASSVGG
jgi:hypothetical protein